MTPSLSARPRGRGVRRSSSHRARTAHVPGHGPRAAGPGPGGERVLPIPENRPVHPYADGDCFSSARHGIYQDKSSALPRGVADSEWHRLRWPGQAVVRRTRRRGGAVRGTAVRAGWGRAGAPAPGAPWRSSTGRPGGCGARARPGSAPKTAWVWMTPSLRTAWCGHPCSASTITWLGSV